MKRAVTKSSWVKLGVKGGVIANGDIPVTNSKNNWKRKKEVWEHERPTIEFKAYIEERRASIAIASSKSGQRDLKKERKDVDRHHQQQQSLGQVKRKWEPIPIINNCENIQRKRSNKAMRKEKVERDERRGIDHNCQYNNESIQKEREEQQSPRRGESSERWKKGHQLPSLVAIKTLKKKHEQHSSKRKKNSERFECKF